MVHRLTMVLVDQADQVVAQHNLAAAELPPAAKVMLVVPELQHPAVVAVVLAQLEVMLLVVQVVKVVVGLAPIAVYWHQSV